jgi:hypothetical protein
MENEATDEDAIVVPDEEFVETLTIHSYAVPDFSAGPPYLI